MDGLMPRSVEVRVTLEVNAEPEEVYQIIDEWIGRTAPEEVVGLQIEVT